MNIHEQAKAIRKAAIGAIICEYGAMEQIGSSKQELKMHLKALISASKRVQNWFHKNTCATEQHRQAFNEEFYSERIYLLSETLELIWDLQPDDIEEINTTLKNHLQPV